MFKTELFECLSVRFFGKQYILNKIYIKININIILIVEQYFPWFIKKNIFAFT